MWGKGWRRRKTIPFAIWTREQWWYFGVFAVVLVIWPGIVYLRGGNATNVIYWLTALVVLAYTVETYGMRREMVRQNEIAVEPVVIGVIESRPGSGPAGQSFRRVLILRNIGKGPALFIRIPELHLLDVAGDRLPFTASYQPVSYLEAGHEHILFAECKAETPTLPGSFFDALKSLDQGSAIETYGLPIHYEDVTGQRRVTAMQMGKDGIRLLRHNKA